MDESPFSAQLLSAGDQKQTAGLRRSFLLILFFRERKE
jgi:hypothetical protein